MKKESKELIRSPLSQKYRSGGKEVEIEIYCTDKSEWILEVVNKSGSSKLCQGTFETDQLAFIQFLTDVSNEGIDSFLEED